MHHSQTTTIRRLLIDLAGDPSLDALPEGVAYRALRAGVHAICVALGPQPSLNAMQPVAVHLDDHCCYCGVELPGDEVLRNVHPRCCPTCVAAGHATGGPLFDGELRLTPAAREELAELYYRAVGCAESGADAAAWQLLEQVSWQVDQRHARPAMIATWLLMGELAAKRGDGRYAWRLLHRCIAYGEQIGDARSIERAEVLMGEFGLRRFDEQP